MWVNLLPFQCVYCHSAFDLTANVQRELALSKILSLVDRHAMADEKTFPKPLSSESLSVESRKLDCPELSDVAKGNQNKSETKKTFQQMNQ